VFPWRTTISRRYLKHFGKPKYSNKYLEKMVTIDILREIALSLPEVTEEPHYEKTSFRVKNKIFATYDEKHKKATLKLSEIDQSVFSAVDQSIIYPVNNKWGKQGWTIVETTKVNKKLFTDAMKAAYCEVAPKKLSTILRSGSNL